MFISSKKEEAFGEIKDNDLKRAGYFAIILKLLSRENVVKQTTKSFILRILLLPLAKKQASDFILCQ
ncbi:MAG: hypothetical protein JSS64_04725 [Bacteroidetes bacterium]|nr:hypothetical protein [Bacteroidota bacterium]